MARKTSEYHLTFCYGMWCFGWFSACSWIHDKLLGKKTSLVKQRTYWKSGKNKRMYRLWKEGKTTWRDYRDAGSLYREKHRRRKPSWSLIWSLQLATHQLLLVATHLDIFWVCAGDQAWGTHYPVSLKKKSWQGSSFPTSPFLRKKAIPAVSKLSANQAAWGRVEVQHSG